MTLHSIMGRKSQLRLDVLMSPGSTIEVRTYKDAFPHLVRGGHLSSRAPWVNNVSLRHHLAKNKVEYKKTRWNIEKQGGISIIVNCHTCTSPLPPGSLVPFAMFCHMEHDFVYYRVKETFTSFALEEE